MPPSNNCALIVPVCAAFVLRARTLIECAVRVSGVGALASEISAVEVCFGLIPLSASVTAR